MLFPSQASLIRLFPFYFAPSLCLSFSHLSVLSSSRSLRIHVIFSICASPQEPHTARYCYRFDENHQMFSTKSNNGAQLIEHRQSYRHTVKFIYINVHHVYSIFPIYCWHIFFRQLHNTNHLFFDHSRSIHFALCLYVLHTTTFICFTYSFRSPSPSLALPVCLRLFANRQHNSKSFSIWFMHFIQKKKRLK